MSNDMPMYRHADETQPAPLMRLPDSGLIFQSIRFSHEEEKWLAFLKEANALLVELVTAFDIGDLRNP